MSQLLLESINTETAESSPAPCLRVAFDQYVQQTAIDQSTWSYYGLWNRALAGGQGPNQLLQHLPFPHTIIVLGPNQNPSIQLDLTNAQSFVNSSLGTPQRLGYITFLCDYVPDLQLGLDIVRHTGDFQTLDFRPDTDVILSENQLDLLFSALFRQPDVEEVEVSFDPDDYPIV